MRKEGNVCGGQPRLLSEIDDGCWENVGVDLAAVVHARLEARNQGIQSVINAHDELVAFDSMSNTRAASRWP